MRQLLIWHARACEALDPATGKVLWTHPWNVKAGLTAPMIRPVGKDRLFLTAFYDGCRMLRVDPSKPDGVEIDWKRAGPNEKKTDGLHAIMATPAVDGEHIYGVCSYGQLRCIKVADGSRVWESLKAATPDGKPLRWANAFIVKHGDRWLLANEQGELIIAKLSPEGYTELSRARIVEPTNKDAGFIDPGRKRMVVWSHPAFAGKCVYMRNDAELVCVSLAKE